MHATRMKSSSLLPCSESRCTWAEPEAQQPKTHFSVAVTVVVADVHMHFVFNFGCDFRNHAKAEVLSSIEKMADGAHLDGNIS